MELTRAESNVYELLMQGNEYDEIAEKLNIKLNTIKVLEHRAYKKKGINGRMDLLARICKKISKKKDLTKLEL